MGTLTKDGTKDPPRKRFKTWWGEWRAAFRHARNPRQYSKKDWAVNILSSLCSYANAGLVALAGWVALKLPWLVPGLKLVWLKITTFFAAMFHVVTGN
jgi:hypothetical protein